MFISDHIISPADNLDKLRNQIKELDKLRNNKSGNFLTRPIVYGLSLGALGSATVFLTGYIFLQSEINKCSYTNYLGECSSNFASIEEIKSNIISLTASIGLKATITGLALGILHNIYKATNETRKYLDSIVDTLNTF